MPTNFPTSLDEFQNPTSTTAMDAPGLEHDVQHANLNDAVEAIQAKLGVNGSAVPGTVDKRLADLEAAVPRYNYIDLAKPGGGYVRVTANDDGTLNYDPVA